ncbi:MAG: ABC transporter permease [Spirochaetota bacterium]
MLWERIQLFCIENLVWVLIGIIFIIFSVLTPSFFVLSTVYSILQDASMLGPLALGLGLCLLAGSFDVSLCRIAGLSCVISAWLHKFTDLPVLLIIPVPLLIGLAIGIFNGLLVGKGGLNPFLVTLAGYLIWYALSCDIMYGKYFPPSRFDPVILLFGRGRIVGGIFVSTVIFVGLLLFIWFFVKQTHTGNAIYAVGGSMDTSRRLGINTNNIKLLVHAIAGVLAGICGLSYVGYAVEIKPVVVPPYTIFPAFVATAIAGISITGGRGNLLNILGGVILIAMTKVGATMMGAPFEFAYYVVPGILFLVVIILINRLDVFRDKILSGIYLRSYAESIPSQGVSGAKEKYGSIRREDQRKI